LSERARATQEQPLRTAEGDLRRAVAELGRVLTRKKSVCESIQVPDDPRRKLVHERHELLANAHSKIAAIAIRRIARELDVVPLEMEEDVRAPGAHERTEPRPRTRSEHGKPTGPGTAEQPQEHRLRTIVGVVRR